MPTLRSARFWIGIAVGLLSLAALVRAYVDRDEDGPARLAVDVAVEGRLLDEILWPGLPLVVLPDAEGESLGLTPETVDDVLYAVVELQNVGVRPLDLQRAFPDGVRVRIEGEGRVLAARPLRRVEWLGLGLRSAAVSAELAADRRSVTVMMDSLGPMQTVDLGIAHTGRRKSLRIDDVRRGTTLPLDDLGDLGSIAREVGQASVSKKAWRRALPVAWLIGVAVAVVGLLGARTAWWGSVATGVLVGSSAAVGGALAILGLGLLTGWQWIAGHDSWSVAIQVLGSVAAGCLLLRLLSRRRWLALSLSFVLGPRALRRRVREDGRVVLDLEHDAEAS